MAGSPYLLILCLLFTSSLEFICKPQINAHGHAQIHTHSSKNLRGPTCSFPAEVRPGDPTPSQGSSHKHVSFAADLAPRVSAGLRFLWVLLLFEAASRLTSCCVPMGEVAGLGLREKFVCSMSLIQAPVPVPMAVSTV